MKKIYIIIFFIACVLIAYFVTKTFYGNLSPESQQDELVKNNTDSSIADISEDSVPSNKSEVHNSQINDVKPEQKKENYKPDTKKVTEKSEKPNKHVNISLSDLKKLIQNGNYSKDFRISKNYRIEYSDVSDDDFGNLQQNLTNVQEHVDWGNWRDFEVIGLDYDESGKVNCIMIRPVY